MENEEKVVKTETAEVTENKEEKSVEVKDVKTFTQEELNEIVEQRLAKAKKGIPSKEELQAFNDWKESQKTEAEKTAEREKENQQIVSERDNLKKENLLLRRGVKEEDIDYVLFKVSKQDGEFEDNLNQFLTDNPKYLTSYVEPTKTVDLGGEHTTEKAESDALARKVMGLK